MCVNNALAVCTPKKLTQRRLRINRTESKMNLHKIHPPMLCSATINWTRRRNGARSWRAPRNRVRILIAACARSIIKMVLCAADGTGTHVRTISIWCAFRFVCCVPLAGKNYVRHRAVHACRLAESIEHFDRANAFRFGCGWFACGLAPESRTCFSRSHTTFFIRTFVSGLAATFC